MNRFGWADSHGKSVSKWEGLEPTEGERDRRENREERGVGVLKWCCTEPDFEEISVEDKS